MPWNTFKRRKRKKEKKNRKKEVSLNSARSHAGEEFKFSSPGGISIRKHYFMQNHTSFHKKCTCLCTFLNRENAQKIKIFFKKKPWKAGDALQWFPIGCHTRTPPSSFGGFILKKNTLKKNFWKCCKITFKCEFCKFIHIKKLAWLPFSTVGEGASGPSKENKKTAK